MKLLCTPALVLVFLGCQVTSTVSDPDQSTQNQDSVGEPDTAPVGMDTSTGIDTLEPDTANDPPDIITPQDTSLTDTTSPDAQQPQDTSTDTGNPVGTTCAVGSRPGTCEDAASCSGTSEPIPGFCPGAANIQCCVAVLEDAIGTPCVVGTRNGSCQDVADCTGDLEPVSGLCPGPGYVQCCVLIEGDPVSGTACNVNGEDGVCIDTTQCDANRVSTPGYCAGPSNIQCCSDPPPATGGSCDPNASPTPNDGLVEVPGSPDCPLGMIRITPAFCVDLYEGSLMEQLGGGAERSWSPYRNPGTAPVRAVSIAGAIPQGYINGNQAAAACAASGKRLCTDTEWLRACQGPSSLTFPYGDTRQDGVCNDARFLHPAVEYFGSSEQWVFSRIDHPCINQLANGLAPTGDHPGCITAEGAFDMMGNLHEWTSDPAGTFRGGYYVDTVRNGPGCLYRTTAHSSAHWDYSTGFRCCAD